MTAMGMKIFQTGGVLYSDLNNISYIYCLQWLYSAVRVCYLTLSIHIIPDDLKLN